MGWDKALAQYLTDLFRRDHCYRRFYKSARWRHLRAQVLADAHYECEDCKRKEPAVYSRATVVHHVCHVHTHKGLALSPIYRGKDGREHPNFVPLCHDCHDKRHGRMGADSKNFERHQLNEERW